MDVSGTLIAIDGDGLSGFDPMDGLEAWYDFENVTGNAVPDRNDKFHCYPITVRRFTCRPFWGWHCDSTTGRSNDRARLQINNATGIDVMVFWTGSAWFRSFIHKGSGVHFPG